jgi:hypothetical protein
VTGSPWVGMDEVMRQITEMAARAQAGARTVVVGSAAIVEAQAKANFAGHHRPGEPHVGGPGSYPNVVTGNLRRSITHTPVAQAGLATFLSTVGPTARYGRRVELDYRYAFFEPVRDQTRLRLQAYQLSVWNRVRG